MKTAVAICLLILPATPVLSQDDRPTGLVFPTVGENMVILLDGSQIRPSAGDTIILPAGRHYVEQVVGNRFRWTIHRNIDTIEIAPGEVAEVASSFGAEHLIVSHPPGAEVFRNGSLLGMTPFLYGHTDRLEGTISLRMEGFETKVIAPSRSREDVFLIRESEERAVTGVSLQPIRPSINNRTWTIASAVVMVGSSVAAAYLKEKANVALDEYQRTGSQSALDDVRRYDTYSAVAAATLVVSFSGFALFLTVE